MSAVSPAAQTSAIASSLAHPRPVAIDWIIKATEWLVVLAAVAYIGGRSLPRSWRHLNTDFPNYYVTARLLREGFSTTRAYEWIWLQRQKDRMGIQASDQPIIGFVPHTPFSALLMWPLTYWPPLAAKRIWILFNLLLLGAVAVQLRSLTSLPWRRIALLIVLNYPLLRNLEYGQYYLVLLFLISSALLLYLKNRRLAAGVFMGIGCGLKIFPAFFLLYFARKRDLRAILGLVIGALASVVASVLAFGLQVHRIYLTQVLPWALRGEAMDPYNLSSSSLSSLLHKLFLFEPQWNHHPLTYAPKAFAILHPLLQMTVLAPAIYLINPKDRHSRQLQIEWSTFLIALLAISTLPASYHFTLLILPVGVLGAVFLQNRDYRSLTLLLLVYVAIGFPAWPHVTEGGWWALLGVPRLYFVLLLGLLCYLILGRERKPDTEWQGDRWKWVAVLVVALFVQIVSTLNHQHGLYNSYSSRIATSPEVLLATNPIPKDDQVNFIAMLADRYVAGSVGRFGTRLSFSSTDQLSQTSADGTLWIEESGQEGRVVDTRSKQSTRVVVNGAEFPVASADGRWLAYLRSSKGRSTIWLRDLSHSKLADSPITPPELDVEEMTFLPAGSLIFSALNKSSYSALYLMGPQGVVQPFDASEIRYPAASPDGRWLAYSRLSGGVWNLWLRDLQTGVTRRLTNADCNDISPSWHPDSKTLVYASDCGRALWFTALVQQHIIP